MLLLVLYSHSSYFSKSDDAAVAVVVVVKSIDLRSYCLKSAVSVAL